jgi:anti-sigma factor RsiW
MTTQESHMGQGCAAWRDDLAAYVLNALSTEEQAAVGQHLATCPACRAEHEYLLPVRDWLAQARQHMSDCGVYRADIEEFIHCGSPPPWRAF